MRLVAKKAELDLNDDPRPMDRVVFNRLKLMVEHEACHSAWGCALYRLHRLGRIDNDQREAGDRYWQIVDDFNRTQATDPDELIPEARDLAYRRVARAKQKYRDAREALGVYWNLVKALVVDDWWPDSERAHRSVSIGLRRLAIFFATGTKRERRK